MPVSYSSKRIRDAQLFARWNDLSNEVFSKHGIKRENIIQLQSWFQGKIVLPDDPCYNKDRMLSNPLFDDHPLMIAYCEVESDASSALSFARDYGLKFCIRSGGHCTAGFSSGPGVLIDVSKLKSIHIDKDRMTAIVGCGVTFGHFNDALNQHGLHVPGGECPDVCIGGYVQGGGYGFTSVTLGMNCDNVIAMRVLLADGSVVVATEEKNHDLWWAMRGGTGGNFGILLSVTYKLHNVEDVLGFALIWPLNNKVDFENAAEVMLELQNSYMFNSPYAPGMNMQVSLCYQTQIVPDGATTKPHGPNWDDDYEGKMKPYLMVRGLYLGGEAEGLDAIKPLQAIHNCYTQWTAMERYNKMNLKLLEYPQEMPVLPSAPIEEKAARYVKKMLSKAQWAELLGFFTKAHPNTAYMYLEFYGGTINAFNQDSRNSNSFIHRDVAYNAVMDVFWFKDEERPAAVAFLAEWKKLMEPYWNGHVYQNYPSPETTDYRYSYSKTYWGNKVEALGRVKHKYDPDTLFRFAQMVPVDKAKIDQCDWKLPKSLETALNAGIDHSGGLKPTGV